MSVLVKVVLSATAETTQTYTKTRILSIDHSEQEYSQTATIALVNSDGVLTSLDLQGYKGIISYGLTTGAGDEYSDCAPLWVIGQEFYSAQGILYCFLTLEGLPNLLDRDMASTSHTAQSDDTKTVKDYLKEIITKVSAWAANTAYVLGDLVHKVATNGYIYRCTDAGTSHATTEPTWGTTIGGTTADNDVIWTCIGREVTAYSHCTSYTVDFDRDDTLIDVYKPKESFGISFNESRLSVIKKLLQNTKCVFRAENDGSGNTEAHIFQPFVETTTKWAATTAYVVGDTRVPLANTFAINGITVANFVYKCTVAGTSGGTEPTWSAQVDPGDTITDGGVTWTVAYNYIYSLATADHKFFSKAYRQRIVLPSKVQVDTYPEAATAYTGSATDAGDSKLSRTEFYRLPVTSDAQAVLVATAILSHYQLNAAEGYGSVPMNVGAEVYDFVLIVDSRQADYRNGNIGYLTRNYNPNQRTWTMNFGFGSVDSISVASLFAGMDKTSGGGISVDPSEAISILADDLNDVRWHLKTFSEFLYRIAGNYAERLNLLEWANGINLTDGAPRTLRDNSTGHVLKLIQEGAGYNLDLIGNAPELRLTENDQTDPAGRYRMIATGDALDIERAATASWATVKRMFIATLGYLWLSAEELANDAYCHFGALGSFIRCAGKTDASVPSSIIMETYNAAQAAYVRRLRISGNAATAAATWSNITHAGLVLSGDLDLAGYDLVNGGTALFDSDNRVIEAIKAVVLFNAQNPSLGTIPAGAYILGAYVSVDQAFNSDGTDTLTCGNDADNAGIFASIDVSTVGIKTVVMGPYEGPTGTAPMIEAYYIAGGSAPTTGQASIVVSFVREVTT